MTSQTAALHVVINKAPSPFLLLDARLVLDAPWNVGPRAVFLRRRDWASLEMASMALLQRRVTFMDFASGNELPSKSCQFLSKKNLSRNLFLNFYFLVILPLRQQLLGDEFVFAEKR